MIEEGAGDHQPAVLGILEKTGVFLWCLMAVAVPLSIAPNLFADEAILLVKRLAATFIASAIIIVASVYVTLGGFPKVTNFWKLGTLLLGGFLLWGSLSALSSPSFSFSFQQWRVTLVLGLAAMSAPLFFRKLIYLKVLMGGILTSGFIVAMIGVISGAGFRGLNRMIYGIDPRDAPDIGRFEETYVFYEGGVERAIAQSTLGNPEYAGTFISVLVVLFAILLWDAFSGKKEKAWLAAVGLCGLAVCLIHLGLTGTRQGWIVILLAAAFRFVLAMRPPGLVAILIYVIPILAGSLFGVLGGGLLFLLGIIVVTGIGWQSGKLKSSMNGLPVFHRILLLAVPVGLAALLILLTIPGPLKPIGNRIIERFSSLTERDDSSVRERVLFYVLASRMALEKPIFGVGPGFYGPRFTPVLADLVEEDETGALLRTRILLGGRYADKAHNDYLQITAESGLPALAFFLALAILLAGFLGRMTFRQGEVGILAMMILLGLFAFYCVMLTSFPLSTAERASLFWTLVGAGLAMQNFTEEGDGSD